jgi:uncharacterized protein
MTVGAVNRDEQTAAFFDGTAAGQLLLRRCPAGHYSEPQAAQCTTCGRTELDWAAAGGDASLVSWAVTRSGEASTVLVIAELDEGPWWWSQLTGADPAGLTVGARLRLVFARPGDTGSADTEPEAVPVFELAG